MKQFIKFYLIITAMFAFGIHVGMSRTAQYKAVDAIFLPVIVGIFWPIILGDDMGVRITATFPNRTLIVGKSDEH